MTIDESVRRVGRYLIDRFTESSTARGLIVLFGAAIGVLIAPDRLDAVALVITVVAGAMKAFLPDDWGRRDITRDR